MNKNIPELSQNDSSNSENKWSLESLGDGDYMTKKDQERYFTWDFMKFIMLAVIILGLAAYFWDYVG